MSLTIELAPETERCLREEAAKRGLDGSEYVRRLIERFLPKHMPTAKELLDMESEQRQSILTAAAKEAASLYDADLARPPHVRDLTALTALDGEDAIEHVDSTQAGRGLACGS